MPDNEKLKSLSTILLHSNNPGTLRKTVHEFHELYSVATGVYAGDITDIALSNSTGKAISPISAAHCLLEYKRTAVFFRGIYKAVLSLQSNFPGEKIHILYAGSGPFATLVTPLTSFFTDKEISFDIMDINPVSLDAVKKLYTELGLLNYVNQFIETDATKYVIDGSKVVHIVISETMNRTLEHEPLVHIMRNLIPQLPGKSIFIPQSVFITACVAFSERGGRSLMDENSLQKIDLGAVYSVMQTACEPHQFSVVKIPRNVKKGKYLYLLTDINVFGDEALNLNDCSLTLPKLICPLDEHAGKSIRFEYILDNSPRFAYKVI